MKNLFESVYQFTTEDISSYLPLLNLKDKEVLTVGSSGDQAFASLLLGAGKVTLFDISPNTYEFVKLKKDIILKYPRKKAYKEILNINNIPINKDLFSYRDLVKMNPCFSNDDNYELTREKLKENEIEFIEGDIFKMDDTLKDRKFDRIIFSNILQYIDYYVKRDKFNTKEEYLKTKIKEWISHLNKDGIIQLMYLYSIRGQIKELKEFLYTLKDYNVYSDSFTSDTQTLESAILSYRKK